MAFVVATTEVATTPQTGWIDAAGHAGDHAGTPWVAGWPASGIHVAAWREKRLDPQSVHHAGGEVRTQCNMPAGRRRLVVARRALVGVQNRTQDQRYREKDESWQARASHTILQENGEDWIFDRQSV